MRRYGEGRERGHIQEGGRRDLNAVFQQHAIIAEDQAEMAGGGLFPVVRMFGRPWLGVVRIFWADTVIKLIAGGLTARCRCRVEHAELIRHAAPVGGEEEQDDEA